MGIRIRFCNGSKHEAPASSAENAVKNASEKIPATIQEEPADAGNITASGGEVSATPSQGEGRSNDVVVSSSTSSSSSDNDELPLPILGFAPAIRHFQDTYSPVCLPVWEYKSRIENCE